MIDGDKLRLVENDYRQTPDAGLASPNLKWGREFVGMSRFVIVGRS